MTPKRRRRRLALLFVPLAAAAAVLALELWLDRSDFRPMAAKAIADATGLPAEIADIDVAYFPALGVRAHGVRIGAAPFGAEVGTVRAELAVGPLLRGAVAVRSIVVTDVRVVIPPDADELDARIRAVRERLAARPAAPSTGRSVAVGRVEIRNASILQHGAAAPLVALEATLQDPTQPALSAALSGSSAYLGPDFVFDGSLRIGADGAVAADLGFAGAELAALAGDVELPFGAMQGRVTGEGPSIDTVRFVIEGGAAPGSGALDLGGALAGVGLWDENTLTVNDLAYTGAGFSVVADLTRHPAGEIVVHLREAAAEAAALEAFGSALPEGMRLAADPEAFVRVTDVYGAGGAGQRAEVISGALSFGGLHIDGADGARLVTALRAEAAFADNRVAIADAGADGLTLRGEAVLDLDARSAAFSLSGEAQLADARIQPLLNEPSLRDMAGTVALESIRFTLAENQQGVPADLHVTGKLSGGVVHIDADGEFVETFKEITGAFTADAKQLEANVAAQAAAMGPVRAGFTLPFESMIMTGTARGRGPMLARKLYWNDWSETVLAPVVAVFEDAAIDWRLELPKEGRKRIDLRAETRNDAGSLRCTAAWPHNGPGKGYGFDGLRVEGAVPAESLHAFAADLKPGGAASFVLDRPEGSKAFALDVDLGAARIEAAPWLVKPAGVPGAVRLAGVSNAPGWRADALAITLAAETIEGAFTGEAGVRFPALDIDLAGLQALLPGGALAAGRVTGAYDTGPESGRFALAGLSLTLDDAVRIDRIDGALQRDGDTWSLRDFRVQGANSDFTVTAEGQGEAWRGEVAGARIDLPALDAAVKALRQRSGGADAPHAPSTPASGLTADVALRAGELIYRNGAAGRPVTFGEVAARVRLQDGGAVIAIDRAVPYSGAVSGTIALSAAPVRSLRVALQADGLDARALDDLFFAEPRGLRGALTGTADFTVPLAEGVHPMDGFSGTVQLAGANGSLGKVGMATQLLAILGALQVWQIHRMPGRDDGLTYDAAVLKLAGNEGNVRVEELALDNPYIKVRGRGLLDFPARNTDVAMDVQVLQGVTRGFAPIPIVGGAAGAVSERIGVVTVKATGSPLAPELAVVGVSGFKGLAGAVLDAGGAAVDAVDKQVVDRIIGTLDSLLRRRN